MVARSGAVTGGYDRQDMEWRRGEYLITTDPERLDHAAVHRFLGDAYWAVGRSADVIERSLANSLVFALFDADRQVGMARVVTDRATFAWLCDVYIDPDLRQAGLGGWLVDVVIGHPDLVGIRRFLLATSFSQTLYARSGFTPLDHPERFMARMAAAPPSPDD